MNQLTTGKTSSGRGGASDTPGRNCVATLSGGDGGRVPGHQPGSELYFRRTLP